MSSRDNGCPAGSAPGLGSSRLHYFSEIGSFLLSQRICRRIDRDFFYVTRHKEAAYSPKLPSYPPRPEVVDVHGYGFHEPGTSGERFS
jgi:hypothetical protein